MTVAAVGPLAAGLSGAKLGGMLAGAMHMGATGTQLMTGVGYMAGMFLGRQLFPQKNKVEMPPMAKYPIQRSDKGSPIPVVFGTDQVAGNIIWMGPSQPYVIKHKASGGKGGGGSQETTETRYRKSFLIGVCEGPANIIRAWKGKTEIDITDFTIFRGDGSNSGLATMVGEDWASYPNLCCAFFDSYELGNSEQIPNFVFEVSYANVVGIWQADNNGYVTRLSPTDYECVERINTTGASCYEVDVHQETGRVCYCQKAQTGVSEPVVIMDRHGNDLGIHFDNSGSSDWANHDSFYAVRFAGENGEYIVAFEFRTGLNGTIWKWDSHTGAKIFRTPVVYTAYSLDTDEDGHVYVSTVKGASPYAVIAKYNGETGVLMDLDRFQGNAGSRDMRIGKFGSYWDDKVISAGSNAWEGWTISIMDFDQPAGDVPEFEVNSGETIFRVFPTEDGYIYACGYNYVYKYDDELRLLAKSAWLGNVVSCMQLPNDKIYVARSAQGTEVPSVVILDGDDLSVLATYDPRNGDCGSFGWGATYGPTCCFLLSSAVGADMNPVDIIEESLTNTRWGARVSQSYIDYTSFQAIREYCAENDLLISVVYDQPRPVLDWIDYICTHFGGYLFWSGGTLHIGAWKDDDPVGEPITAGDLVSRRAIDEANEGDEEPPVTIRKRMYSETFNRVEVTWQSRADNYGPAIATAEDAVDQRVSSQMRKQQIELAGAKTAALGQKLAYKLLFDSMYRFSIYAFTLGPKSQLLEVGDVKLLSDGYRVSNQRIRITSVSESVNGMNLDIEAVDDIAHLYPTIGWICEETERVEDEPVTLVEPTINFREDISERVLYLSCAPSDQYVNGWNIYGSRDANSYEWLGKATIDGVTSGNANSVGALTSALPAAKAIINRRDESFTVNIGTVTDLRTSVTESELLAGLSLAKIGNEIVGYKDCVETGTAGVWQVTNLVRGMFNTEPVAHAVGETFATLDIDFAFVLRHSDAGQTLYFKACPFYGNQAMSVDNATAQTWTAECEYRKPCPAQLIHIEDQDGFDRIQSYPVTMETLIGNRQSGYGSGGYGDLPYGHSVPDRNITALVVRVLQQDGTQITSTRYDIDGDESKQFTIADADRDGHDPVDVEVYPVGLLAADARTHVLQLAN